MPGAVNLPNARGLAARLARLRKRLAASQTGAVIIEFAYTMPVFVLLSFGTLELVNISLAHMRVNQIAMTTADNLSRAKTSVPLGLPRLREIDINDTFIGASIQGGESFGMLTDGRIIISSLQQTSSGRQTIAWQRCKGSLAVVSRYGVQGTTQPSSGTGGFQGMGRAGQRVQAEPNSAVIFAEVTYDYQPIIGNWLFGSLRINKEAAFYVRDDRDLVGGAESNGLYNPTPAATVSACNVYNSTF